MPHLTSRETADRHAWGAIRIYSLYRLLLASLLFGIFLFGTNATPFIGGYDRHLYALTATVYLLLTGSSLIPLRGPRWRIVPISLIILLCDVIALSLFMHASGGLNSSLAILIAVTVMAGNILLAGRLGQLISASATIAIIYEQFFFSLQDRPDPESLAQAGILGLALFGIAILTQNIARRLRDSEALALERGMALARMQELNAQIIHRMRTGIVVIDNNDDIMLGNESARQLLGIYDNCIGHPLEHISLTLQLQLNRWRVEPSLRLERFRNTAESPVVQANFARLDSLGEQQTLIFLEDTAQLAQQAQQMKLASLGRFTAGIAHEIRNPLGAISHAAQLLGESPQIDDEDRRLTTIVQHHVQRMNAIIENILRLSRRDKPSPEIIDATIWLASYVTLYQEGRRPVPSIHLDLPDTLRVRVDTAQMEQVLTNLLDNALRYSLRHSQKEICILRAYNDPDSLLPVIEVQDFGPGLTAEQREHLFEPFYTTEAQGGTGLGLYLSREICDGHQARLVAIPVARGACFRITLAHPDRMA